ncbi:isochorismatase family protein [Desulfosediminicola sp.]|uniref:isochorismatase family protein n=1 Tax=Desulfosediminicola sp. TaxID=2886825 RepID=UPI003AF2AB01
MRGGGAGMANTKLLTPESCYLHVIDVQESLMKHVHGADKVADITGMMVHSARIFGMPIMGNTQYKKGLGPYVSDLEPLFEDIPRHDKVEFNALANAETMARVNSLPSAIDTMILVGVETHICVYQTAMAALDLGLKVWIVSDGVSSRRREHHQMALERLAGVGADIGPAEMLIYELLHKAGTPRFKEILPLILKQG